MSVNTRGTKGRTYGGEEVAAVVPSDGLNGIFMSCQAEHGGRFLLDVPDLYLHADKSAYYPHTAKSRSLRHGHSPHWPRHPPRYHSIKLVQPSSLHVQTRRFPLPNAQQGLSNLRGTPTHPPASPKTCPLHPGNPTGRSSSLHQRKQARFDSRHAEPTQCLGPVQSGLERGESNRGVW